jgi:hypothetical protein
MLNFNLIEKYCTTNLRIDIQHLDYLFFKTTRQIKRLQILVKGTIPDKWRDSTLIPIFKEKGDVQRCENYRRIKLMSHTLKILERILDGQLRMQVTIGRQQLGFMKGLGRVMVSLL